MPVDCKLVEKESKTGNKYVCLEITIYGNVKKIVFLNQSELELIKLAYKKN